jgi:hypothetical protein
MHSPIQRALEVAAHRTGKALHTLREHTVTADDDGEEIHEEVNNSNER